MKSKSGSKDQNAILKQISAMLQRNLYLDIIFKSRMIHFLYAFK